MTCGGGGAADFVCDWPCPQPASASAIMTTARIVLVLIGLLSRTVARIAVRASKRLVRGRAQFNLSQRQRTETKVGSAADERREDS